MNSFRMNSFRMNSLRKRFSNKQAEKANRENEDNGMEQGTVDSEGVISGEADFPSKGDGEEETVIKRRQKNKVKRLAGADEDADGVTSASGHMARKKKKKKRMVIGDNDLDNSSTLTGKSRKKKKKKKKVDGEEALVNSKRRRVKKRPSKMTNDDASLQSDPSTVATCTSERDLNDTIRSLAINEEDGEEEGGSSRLSLENQGINGELEKMREEKILLQKSVNVLKVDKEKLKEFVSALNRQLEEVETELESLQTQRAEAFEAQEERKALEGERDKLLDENKELKESLEAEVKKVQSLWSMMTTTSSNRHLRSSLGRNNRNDGKIVQ